MRRRVGETHQLAQLTHQMSAPAEPIEFQGYLTKRSACSPHVEYYVVGISVWGPVAPFPPFFRPLLAPSRALSPHICGVLLLMNTRLDGFAVNYTLVYHMAEEW